MLFNIDFVYGKQRNTYLLIITVNNRSAILHVFEIYNSLFRDEYVQRICISKICNHSMLILLVIHYRIHYRILVHCLHLLSSTYMFHSLAIRYLVVDIRSVQEYIKDMTTSPWYARCHVKGKKILMTKTERKRS